MLLPLVWTWGDWIQEDSTLATGALVGVLTAMLISVSSPQLIEEANGGGYGIDKKCFFEFDCLDFMFTCSKCWLEVREEIYSL